MRMIGVVAALLVATLFVAAELGYSGTRPLDQSADGILMRICEDPVAADCEIRAPEPGEQFHFGFSVRNTGLLPLTITDVDLESAMLVSVDGIRVVKDMNEGLASSQFRPFTLDNGDDRVLLVEAHADPCYEMVENGTFRGITQIQVTFRWLLVTQTQGVPLPEGLLRFPYTRTSSCQDA